MFKNFLVSLLLIACSLSALAQQNVILIIADDLGTDYCGFYEDGLDTAKMPNIRSLLANGVRFDQAWSFPYCSEIRAAALTGRNPFRTGVGTVITSAMNGQLDTAEITIGKLLKTAAPVEYTTANIGKWHLHTQTQASRNNPAVLGYDHYAGNFSGQINDYYSWTKIIDGAAPVTVTNYATTEQTDDAIAWLETLDGSKPFFLWQAYNAPHFPFHLPPASLHTVSGLTGTPAHIAANRPEYFKAMVESMDTEIGRLFNWLDAHNLRDSTNIIFIGDNGDDSRICQLPNPDRAKGTIYQNGIHVPMIISGPAVVSPNRNSNAIVSTTDLFATVLELAGFSDWQAHISVSKPVDAVSLLPVLKNEATSVHDWVFSEVFDPAGKPEDGKAIRDLSYKLMRFDDGHEEFYQIATDPYEFTNLLLQLPLSAEASAHYAFLCNALAGLVGTPACDPAVTSTHEHSEKSIVYVSPNPAKGTLFIQNADNLNLVSGKIFDLKGQMFLSFSLGANRQVNISSLPNGPFLLKVTDEKGKVYSTQFVKMIND